MENESSQFQEVEDLCRARGWTLETEDVRSLGRCYRVVDNNGTVIGNDYVIQRAYQSALAVTRQAEEAAVQDDARQEAQRRVSDLCRRRGWTFTGGYYAEGHGPAGYHYVIRDDNGRILSSGSSTPTELWGEAIRNTYPLQEEEATSYMSVEDARRRCTARGWTLLPSGPYRWEVSNSINTVIGSGTTPAWAYFSATRNQQINGNTVTPGDPNATLAQVTEWCRANRWTLHYETGWAEVDGWWEVRRERDGWIERLGQGETPGVAYANIDFDSITRLNPVNRFAPTPVDRANFRQMFARAGLEVPAIRILEESIEDMYPGVFGEEAVTT